MSAQILQNPSPVTHTLWDDMESAFWVLVYQAMRYLRHNLDRHHLYCSVQRLFADPILESSGATDGLRKMNVILACASKRSTSHIAEFERTGLNSLLSSLGVVFDYHHGEGETPPCRNLDDPDGKWFPALLRTAAMDMEPLRITPTGLKSPTNNSNPPNDANEWRPTSVKDVESDFFEMPWTSNPRISTKAQQR